MICCHCSHVFWVVPKTILWSASMALSLTVVVWTCNMCWVWHYYHIINVITTSIFFLKFFIGFMKWTFSKVLFHFPIWPQHQDFLQKLLGLFLYVHNSLIHKVICSPHEDIKKALEQLIFNNVYQTLF